MSPNLAAILLSVIALVSIVAGMFFIVGALKDGDAAVFWLSVAAISVGFVIIISTAWLHSFAVGDCHYERRDNPDGTRTWQRVEVKP